MRWDRARALTQSRTAWLKPSSGDSEAESVFLVLPALCWASRPLPGPGLACTHDSAQGRPWECYFLAGHLESGVVFMKADSRLSHGPPKAQALCVRRVYTFQLLLSTSPWYIFSVRGSS